MKKLSMLAALACMTVGPLLATSAQAQFASPRTRSSTASRRFR